MSQTTKQALAMALKKLMLTIPFDKITVKDVAQACGVNRQTFYYHFQNIYELLGWIYKEEALTGIEQCKTYETWQDGFLHIFHYILENKSFCKNTFLSSGREHFHLFAYNIAFELLLDVVKEVAHGIDVPEAKLRFIANFYTCAFIGILFTWFIGGMKEEPREIVSNTNTLIEGDIKRAVEKFRQETC